MSWRDVAVAARRSIAARKARSVLMGAGAAIGVGILVASQGVLLSGKGEVRLRLGQLGTNLVVVDSAGDAGLPFSAADRAASLDQVLEVASINLVADASATSPRSQGYGADTVSTPVWSASDTFLEVVRGEIRAGRALHDVDDRSGLSAVVVGARLAEALALNEPFDRTIWVGDHQFGVVGILAPVALAPELDGAVLVTPSTAQEIWGDSGRPSRLLVRVEPTAVESVAAVLPIAVSRGETDLPTVRVASALLEAQAAVDRGLQAMYLMVGALAIAVGSFAIYNSMLLSMIERRREIGVLRAIGHQREVVAGQFLLESVFVGFCGALAGAALGVLFTVGVAASQDWPVSIALEGAVGAMGVATMLAALVGALVAVRAARLEPLSALAG